MPRRERVLDTNELIFHWHASIRRPLSAATKSEATVWARSLIGLRGTDAIVTPVEIEFLAGVSSQHEMALSRAYLQEFRIIDDGRVLPQDWDEARRLASRIPRVSKPRQLVDCLIRALARRLNFDIITRDRTFPK
jgi:predicted nucleic acid-binding protein